MQIPIKKGHIVHGIKRISSKSEKYSSNYDDFNHQNLYAEVGLLIPDPSKTKEKLSWEQKVQFEELLKMMVEEDVKRLERS